MELYNPLTESSIPEKKKLNFKFKIIESFAIFFIKTFYFQIQDVKAFIHIFLVTFLFGKNETRNFTNHKVVSNLVVGTNFFSCHFSFYLV